MFTIVKDAPILPIFTSQIANSSYSLSPMGSQSPKGDIGLPAVHPSVRRCIHPSVSCAVAKTVSDRDLKFWSYKRIYNTPRAFLNRFEKNQNGRLMSKKQAKMSDFEQNVCRIAQPRWLHASFSYFVSC